MMLGLPSKAGVNIQTTGSVPVRFGRRPPTQTWRLCFRQGLTALDKNDNKQAQTHFRRALELAELQEKSPTHPSLSLCYNAIATTFHRMGESERSISKAEQHYQKAYDFFNRAYSVDLDNAPRYGAFTLFNTSKLKLSQGDTQKARALMSRVVRILEDKKPIQDVDLARATFAFHLGLLYLKDKQMPEAKTHIKTALAQLTRLKGTNHPWSKDVEKLVRALHTNPDHWQPFLKSVHLVSSDFGQYFENLMDEMRLIPKASQG